MAENPLTRLPLVGQLGVALVVAALVCFGFYWFSYSDLLKQQADKEAQLADLQKQIRALEARLETLKRILPPEKEMPDLMRRVQYLAAQSSLRVAKFNPTAPKQNDFYQEVPISLELEGTFHNFGAFLDRVSRMSRLVNMGDVKIKAQAQPTISSTISIGATATTYVFLDTAPPGAQGAAQRPRPGAVR